MRDHRLKEWTGNVVETVQVRGHHLEPILRLKPKQKIVLPHACVVDQHLHIIVRMIFLPTCYRLYRLISVGHIELQQFSTATSLLNQTQSLLSRSIIGNIINHDTEPHLSQFHTDRPADPTASTGHKSVFRHKIFKINLSANLRNNSSSS